MSTLFPPFAFGIIRHSIAAAGTSTVPALQAVGGIAHSRTGSGSATLLPIRSSGILRHSLEASGSATLSYLSASGTLIQLHTITGTGSATLPALHAGGGATFAIKCYGLSRLPALSSEGLAGSAPPYVVTGQTVAAAYTDTGKRDIKMSLTITEDLEPIVDWQIANGDLVMDGTLLTPVICSLLTDAEASASDEIPDGTGLRRGWYGDHINNSSYGIGSRLWLLSREVQSIETLNNAIGYCQEALKWLVDYGIADAVNVTADFGNNPSVVGRIFIYITISQGTTTQKYNLVWNATATVLG